MHVLSTALPDSIVSTKCNGCVVGFFFSCLQSISVKSYIGNSYTHNDLCNNDDGVDNSDSDADGGCSFNGDNRDNIAHEGDGTDNDEMLKMIDNDNDSDNV